MRKESKTDSYSSEIVPYGVVPEMTRGGKFAAIGQFGWRTEEEMLGQGSSPATFRWQEWVEEPKSNRLGHPDRNRRRAAA
jgi:hypothetical protein